MKKIRSPSFGEDTLDNFGYVIDKNNPNPNEAVPVKDSDCSMTLNFVFISNATIFN